MTVLQLVQEASTDPNGSVVPARLTLDEQAALACLPLQVVNAFQYGAAGDMTRVTCLGTAVTFTLADHDVAFTVGSVLSAWERIREVFREVATDCQGDAGGPVIRRITLPKQLASLSWGEGDHRVMVGSLTTSSSPLRLVPAGRAS